MTQMLRRRALFLLGRGKDLDRAPGLFDGGHRRFGSAVNLNIDLGLDFAAPQKPHAIPGAAQHAGLYQRLGVEGVLGVDQFGIDGLLNPVEIDLDKFEPENVGETALRQAPMQRHLAALKALDAHAGACSLTLAATARGLALAGADATANTHPLFARAGIVGDIAQLHRTIPYLPSSRPRRERDAEPWRSCRGPRRYPSVRPPGRSC